MSKIRKIVVDQIEITLSLIGEEDYISLTDMMEIKDGDFFISDWMRNGNTLEYLGAWEALNNPDFNYGEFARIKNKSGTNAFKISVKEWVKKTNAIGINAKAGRYGGTYAHKDIAFNFGMWLSPSFQLYVARAYQILKEEEAKNLNVEWSIRRVLTKVNYKIHTAAVKDYIIPKSTLPADQLREEYSNEADVLNMAIFGCTSKEWKAANPTLVLEGKRLRDIATIEQLTVLANIENVNAVLMKKEISKADRLIFLKEIAETQLKNLAQLDELKSNEGPQKTAAIEKPISTHHRKLKKA